MKIYAYDPSTGEYLGESTADPHPLRADEFLIPAFATPVPPPAHTETQRALWVDDQWGVEDIPAPAAAEPLTASEQRDEKLRSINSNYEIACAVFKNKYPRTEIDGWPEQVRALDAYDANPQAENVLIDILAQHNGVTRAQMAEAIRAARNRFVNAYAQLTGLRQQLQNALDAIDINASDATAQISAIDETQLQTLAQQIAALSV